MNRKFELPQHLQKASRLVPLRETAIAGRVAATITESIATTTEIKQSMKTVTLNLKGFFGVSTGLLCVACGLSSCMMDGTLELEVAPSSFSCIVIDVDDNSDSGASIVVLDFMTCFQS